MAKNEKMDGKHGDRPVGTLIVYDRQGAEIHKAEDFTAGRDKMPAGISLTAGASVVLDPRTGEVLKRWDPWNVLGSKV